MALVGCGVLMLSAAGCGSSVITSSRSKDPHMLLIYGGAIGVAILSLWWAITAQPTGRRTNLMAGIDLPPQASASRLHQGVGQAPALPPGVIHCTPGHPPCAGRAPLEAGPLRPPGPLKVLVALFSIGFGFLVGIPAGFFGGLVVFLLPDFLVLAQRARAQRRDPQLRRGHHRPVGHLRGGGARLRRRLHTSRGANEGPLAVELQRAVRRHAGRCAQGPGSAGVAERTQLPEINQLVTRRSSRLSATV